MDVNDIGIALLRGLFASLPFGAALALGVMLPLAVAGLASVTGRLSPSTRALVIVGSLVLGSALSVAFSGRTLYSDAELVRNPYLALALQTQSGLSIRISQLFTLVSLLVSAAEIFRCIGASINILSPVSKLWLAFLLFNFVSVGLAGVFGEFRSPDLKYIYFIIVFSGISSIASEINFEFWRRLRWLMLVPSAGSLLCMAVAPKTVLLSDYSAFIPGLHSRLFGLSEHANGIGILAAAALVIEFSAVVRKNPSVVMALLHILVLILAQSKTAWIAAFVVLVIVRWRWMTSSGFNENKWRRQMWIVVIGLFFAALIIALLLMAASSKSLTNALEAKSVFTLTGRFRIWQLTIIEFFRHPILGYGPSLWDIKFRMERGIPFAGQAHNQFVQVLGQAGVLGLLSMLIYLARISRMVVGSVSADHGLGLALFVLLLARCVTESPLRINGIMGWENILHLLVLVAAASGAAKLNSSSEMDESYPNGGASKRGKASVFGRPQLRC